MNDKEVYSEAIKSLIPEIVQLVADILSKDNTKEKNSDLLTDVFVIISFSEDMEPIYDGMKAAGEKVGLSVNRVKDIIGDYKITDHVESLIRKSKFILADLTHERPNVYFELGYARGVGKTVITTARQGTNIHFDVKDWPCIYYNDSRILEKKLEKRFQQELDKI